MAERADELMALIAQYVPDGFRDDDGVWHDGPHRVKAFAALDALLAELESLRRDTRGILRAWGLGETDKMHAFMLSGFLREFGKAPDLAASGGGSDG